MLVTGGDDHLIRLMTFKTAKYDEITTKIELEGAQDAITGVDIYRDNSRLAASSKDCNVYIYDVKLKKLLDKVCFKYSPDVKNMVMRDCLLHNDGSLYTLAVEARKPTYLIKWKPEGNSYSK